MATYQGATSAERMKKRNCSPLHAIRVEMGGKGSGLPGGARREHGTTENVQPPTNWTSGGGNQRQSWAEGICERIDK